MFVKVFSNCRNRCQGDLKKISLDKYFERKINL